MDGIDIASMVWARLVPELTVSDFAKSLEFYQRLGFKILWQRDDPMFAYLDFEGAQIMLEQFHTTGWNVAELVKPYGRGINFQIECSSATALRDKALGRGQVLYRDLKEIWYKTGDKYSGNCEFLLQDPDGYLLRFSEYLGERKEEMG
jgi:catechol 2,3-dioxygenase-like lactoylglutathione lyase family enzyme